MPKLLTTPERIFASMRRDAEMLSDCYGYSARTLAKLFKISLSEGRLLHELIRA